VTVLRDGRHQGTFDAAGITEDDLVARMIGRPLDVAFPTREATPADAPIVLRTRDLRGPGLGPVDLQLRAGEILGIAGAAGNGVEKLLRCLAGTHAPRGTIECGGAAVQLDSPYQAIRAGIVFLSGDRVRESLFPVLGVRANATVQVLSRFRRLGLIRRREEGRSVERLVESHKVRTPSIAQPVRFLSGGNQQKVSLMRSFLHGQLNVIVAEEPTQGVDVVSRLDIYNALRAKANEGVGVIVGSSDPIELSGLCDRVIVLSRGPVVDVIGSDELDEQRIVEAIVGRRAAAERAGSLSEEDQHVA
jgi:ribose transport system ATP-binding protein